MFKFLKDKLKDAVGLFSKKADEEAEKIEEPVEEPVKQAPKKEVKKESPKEENKEKKPEKVEKTEVKEEKKSRVSEKAEPKVEKKHEEKPKVEPKVERKVEHKPSPKVEKKPEVKHESKPVHKEVLPVEAEPEPKHETPAQKVEHKAVEQKEEKKKGGFFGLFSKKEEVKVEQQPEQKHVEPKEEKKREHVPAHKEKVDHKEQKVEREQKIETKHVPVEEEKKKSFFGAIKDSVTKVKLSEEKFQELFFDLEITLLENNVALEVIERIKQDLHQALVGKAVDRGTLESTIIKTLSNTIADVLSVPSIDVIKQAKDGERPYVIAFIGINGSGKTTSLAKFANLLQSQGLSVVIAACDTYRAAAIQQLEHHANALNIRLVKHTYGADPSAVAFDAVAHAKAKGIDVVLIDTAGRLHHNENLMTELHKLIRVAKPHLKIFVGESYTGNDCVEQARMFNEKVGIDGIILSKADVDEKGGAAISVSYVTQKPILYIGTGQEYKDLEVFSKDKVLSQIGLE